MIQSVNLWKKLKRFQINANKFLKILGICVLIVLLPVFIAVTAVCLVEDTNEMNDAKLPTYSVNCGEHAESVKIKEKDGEKINYKEILKYSLSFPLHFPDQPWLCIPERKSGSSTRFQLWHPQEPPAPWETKSYGHSRRKR